MSITHLSNKSDWTPVLLTLVFPSPLIISASPLMVSIDVPNEPIPWSSGTALANV